MQGNEHEIDLLRLEIQELEKDKLFDQQMLSQIDSELRDETVRNFSINQEVDRYIRKGKQPAKNQTGQRNTANHKNHRHDDYSTKNNRASENLVLIPQDDDDDFDGLRKLGKSRDPYGSSNQSKSTNDYEQTTNRMSIDTI